MKPTFLLIGLGNPGSQYEKTRHNVGWLAIDCLHATEKGSEWSEKPKFLSALSETTIDGHSVLLVKPLTYMNRSGEAIRKLVDFYKLNPATQILVCCDDIDLPLGTHRLRMSGGPGTHNGLKSIVECIGENFPRLRIGLGSQPEGQDLASWVLSSINAEEKKVLQPALKTMKSAMLDVMKQAKKS